MNKQWRFWAVALLSLTALGACSSDDDGADEASDDNTATTAEPESDGGSETTLSDMEGIQATDVPYEERTATQEDWPVGEEGKPIYVFEDGTTVGIDADGYGRVGNYSGTDDCGEGAGAYVVAVGGKAGMQPDNVLAAWACF